jgi:hypothetical protein
MWQFTGSTKFKSDLDKVHLAILEFTDGTSVHYSTMADGNALSETAIEVGRNAVLARLNKIADLLDADKEAIKADIIMWMKATPEATLADFVTHAEAEYGWQNRALFERLMYDYSQNAAAIGLLPSAPTTREEAWSALMGLIAANDLEVIQSWFQ